MGIVRSAAKLLFAGTDLFLPSPPGPRILIYHQVGSGLGRQMEVTLSAFSRQMHWLAENREVVSLDDGLLRWDDEGADQLVVLTFDDGYLDVFTTAFPLLRDLGFPFTLYLTTDPIESGHPIGSHVEAMPLSWANLETIMSSGLLTVGAHTHTHPDLRCLSAEQIEDELQVSNSLIASRLGTLPSHFAYPWGYWSAGSDPVVRKTYETAALGGPTGSVTRPDSHRFHRFPVQLSDGFRFFRSRLEGGLLLEERVRRLVRGYQGP